MPSFRYIYMGIIVPASILIPIGIGFYRRKNIGEAMRTIFFYLFLDGLVNVFVIYLTLLKTNNLPVLHIFTIIEFLFISVFYAQVLKEKIFQKFIYGMMIIFPVLCIVNFMYFQDITKFNTNTRPIEALLVIIYSLIYFAQNNEDNIIVKWESNPINWISTGLLLYFSGALFIFSFSNITSSTSVSKNHNLDILIWTIHATLLLLMYLLFAKGFSKCRKK